MTPACKRLLWPAAASLAAAALLFLALGRGTQLPPATIGGPFRLTDTDGHAVTERSFAGRFKLLYFGYTACPDVCPQTLTHIAAALTLLGPQANRIQPLFVTLDPAQDTPPVLRRYTRAFSPRLIGLTGTPDQLRHMQTTFHVWSAPAPHRIEHSAVLYLLGPDGAFIAPVRADASGAEMARQLAGLVAAPL